MVTDFHKADPPPLYRYWSYCNKLVMNPLNPVVLMITDRRFDVDNKYFYYCYGVMIKLKCLIEKGGDEKDTG